MKNYVQHGATVSFTAPSGGVVSGTGYLIGSAFVVAQFSAAQGLPFEGRLEGVFTLPKATGQTWAEGVVLYWDNTAHNVTTTSTSNTKIGVATVAALTGDTSGVVRLNGAF